MRRNKEKEAKKRMVKVYNTSTNGMDTYTFAYNKRRRRRRIWCCFTSEYGLTRDKIGLSCCYEEVRLLLEFFFFVNSGVVRDATIASFYYYSSASSEMDRRRQGLRGE